MYTQAQWLSHLFSPIGRVDVDAGNGRSVLRLHNLSQRVRCGRRVGRRSRCVVAAAASTDVVQLLLLLLDRRVCIAVHQTDVAAGDLVLLQQ